MEVLKAVYHVGVLKALHEDEITTHNIVGSSTGAAVAISKDKDNDKDYEEIIDFLKSFNYHKLWSLESIAKGYIADTQKVINVGRDFFGVITLSDLKIQVGIQSRNMNILESLIFYE